MSDGRQIVCIVRHGRTALNAGMTFRGHLDVPLDDVGLDQAQRTGRLLAEMPIRTIYTSPLQRAVQTADAIAAQQAAGVEVAVHHGLIDLCYGRWEGKTHQQVRQEFPDAYRMWQSQPHKAVIPGGETLAAVRARSWAACQEVLGRDTGAIIALVSHRVVNKLLLASVLGLTEADFWKIQQDTCCVNLVQNAGGAFTVLKMNHSAHIHGLSESIEAADF